MCCALKNVDRQKRFLIVPPTAPTRHQLIWGVGIPLDYADYSVTTGYTLKGQYFLPTSIDQIRPDFFIYDRSIKSKRSIDDNENKSENFYIDSLMGIKVESYNVTPVVIETPLVENDNDNDYDDQYIDYENHFVWREKTYNNDYNTRAKNSRWMIYKMIETFADKKGLKGRECVLKSICEAAEVTFSHKSGIIGELLHILLT